MALQVKNAEISQQVKAEPNCQISGYMGNWKRTIPRMPPELTKSALAFPDCHIAPSRSGGRQLKPQRQRETTHAVSQTRHNPKQRGGVSRSRKRASPVILQHRLPRRAVGLRCRRCSRRGLRGSVRGVELAELGFSWGRPAADAQPPRCGGGCGDGRRREELAGERRGGARVLPREQRRRGRH